MKYKQFVKINKEKALENNKEEAAVILLLQKILDVNSSKLFMMLEDEITEAKQKEFDLIFDKYLYENKPIQYLIGTSNFYGYDFIVNENVLIPRFETEELVDNILFRYDKYFKNKEIDVCDLATGSGCIAITLAKEEKNMHVIATDISFEALDVARKNNEKLGTNVEFLQGDMLKPLEGKKFDIFVIGPAPANISKINDIYRYVFYIKSSDYEQLISIKDCLEDILMKRENKRESVFFDFDPQNMV